MLIGNRLVQLFICLILFGSFCCKHEEHRKVEDIISAGAGKAASVQKLEVPPPPFSEDIFPCSECHNGEDVVANPNRRELEDEHEDISLRHDEKNRWCLDCHDLKNRDKLHLASGELVDFNESYRLCGQCHGPKLRDWKAGIHGRRKGEWGGRKQYLLCAHCHNPHSPRFKPIKPKPPPVKPVKPGLFSSQPPMRAFKPAGEGGSR